MLAARAAPRPAAVGDDVPGGSLSLAWVGLAILAIAQMFSVVDRQILVLVAEPLRRAMALSDTQIGLLNGFALTLVTAIATYPMGMLADRMDRRWLLAACVLVWSAFTAACGFARDFGTLFACTMGIAVGEAVINPIGYSLIADLFPRRLWLPVNYVFYLCNMLGQSAALALGSAAFALAEAHRAALPMPLAGFDGWRLAMIVTALPGPLIALAVLTMRTRARHRDAAAAGAPVLPYLRAHARTLAGIFLGFGCAASVYYSLLTWLIIGLTRDFGQSPAEVGTRVGATAAAASIGGVLLSGLLVRRLRPRLGERALVTVAQGAFIATAVALIGLGFATTAGQVYAMFFLIALPMVTALSLSPTILQNLAPGWIRARVLAAGVLFFVGLSALMPMVTGLISDSPFGRRHGLYPSLLAVSVPGVLLGALLLGMASRTLAATLRAAAEEDER